MGESASSITEEQQPSVSTEYEEVKEPQPSVSTEYHESHSNRNYHGTIWASNSEVSID